MEFIHNVNSIISEGLGPLGTSLSPTFSRLKLHLYYFMIISIRVWCWCQIKHNLIKEKVKIFFRNLLFTMSYYLLGHCFTKRVFSIYVLYIIYKKIIYKTILNVYLNSPFINWNFWIKFEKRKKEVVFANVSKTTLRN